MSCYPWQRAAWELYAARWSNATVPHALLIAGPRGLGKRALAAELAASLLCRVPREEAVACRNCGGCRQLAAAVHPDYWQVSLEPKRSQIRVEQIRELIAFVSLTSQHGGRKVAVIEPAERMNASAANALLKTLEEPPGEGVLVLVSELPGRLPATVRSRCVPLQLRPPPAAEVAAWLRARNFQGDPALATNLARGRPLAALEWGRGGRLERRLALFEALESLLGGRCGALPAAQTFGASDTREAMGLLAAWTRDLLRLRLAGADAELEHPDLRPRLLRLAHQHSPRWLLARLDEAHRGEQLCDTPVAPQLLVEDVLVGWSGAGEPP